MRPNSLLTGWAVALSIFLGAIPPALAATSANPPLKTVHIVIPENSILVLGYLGGKEAGIFRKHGIQLTVDVRPFAGYLAGLPAKQCMVTTYSGLTAVGKINEGLNWAIIGGGLTVINGVIVRKDSPFKTLAQLRGKRLGIHSVGSGSFKAVRAAILAASGFDIVKDTKLVQVPPPVLYKMLEDGQVDAMINESSFTVRALSQPDKFRSIFSPNDYWRKRTGYPLGWASPMVAWKSWVEQDPARAKAFTEAAEESFRWLRNPNHFDAAVKNYGKLAGVTAPAQIALYKKLLAAKEIFLTHWNRKIADAEWKFLELAKSENILKKVPSEAQHALLLTASK